MLIQFSQLWWYNRYPLLIDFWYFFDCMTVVLILISINSRIFRIGNYLISNYSMWVNVIVIHVIICFRIYLIGILAQNTIFIPLDLILFCSGFALLILTHSGIQNSANNDLLLLRYNQESFAICSNILRNDRFFSFLALYFSLCTFLRILQYCIAKLLISRIFCWRIKNCLISLNSVLYTFLTG